MILSQERFQETAYVILLFLFIDFKKNEVNGFKGKLISKLFVHLSLLEHSQETAFSMYMYN